MRTTPNRYTTMYRSLRKRADDKPGKWVSSLMPFCEEGEPYAVLSNRSGQIVNRIRHGKCTAFAGATYEARACKDPKTNTPRIAVRRVQ
ncbi:MAG: hypothetical protein HKN01_01395 [Acidimicrobiia bacterium]|nr:hypothetical protein [Acidimicrobiia bacterium]